MNNENSLEKARVIIDGARYVMQAIAEHFFERFDPDSAEGKFAILYEFKRYRAFSRILDDLMFGLSKEIESAMVTSNERTEAGV